MKTPLGHLEQERALERLLSRTRRPEETAPLGACLDAETLAAWVDGALGATARSAAERHAADCPRCQAMLAAMTRATPAAVPPQAAPRRLLAWLVPLTAAAAAIAIWIAVPSNPRPPAPVGSVARQEAPKPAVPQPAGKPAAASEPSAPNVVDELRDAPTRPPERRPAAEPPPREAGSRLDATAKKEDARTRMPAAAAAPPAQAAEQKAAEADAAAARNLPAAPVAPSANALAKLKTLQVAGAAVDVVSSNPGSRWRLFADGRVLHSADGGSTWEPQQTGVTVALGAGASPSPSVCWLAGPRGTVLLTVDGGQSWRRLAFPEPADLVAVGATDDKTATVTTSDGRSFRTTDGGQTWVTSGG